jgi:hypothetical protein
MTTEDLKNLLTASPFKPFTIYTAGEKAFFIPHPEFALLTPRGRTIVVANTQHEGVDIVDVPLISRIELHDPTKSTP